MDGSLGLKLLLLLLLLRRGNAMATWFFQRMLAWMVWTNA